MEWTRDEVLSAVRTGLRTRLWLPHLRFERADLVGDLLLVVVLVQWSGEAERLGVYYSLASIPKGPNTGIESDTPRQWAAEVGWDVEEFVALETNERLPGPEGVTIVRWWPDDSIARG